MADSSISITGGAVDTRTTASGDHRQVMVNGDESTDAIAGVTDVAAIPGALQRGAREQWVGNAMNVNINAIQLATYKAVMKPTASALTANTLSLRCSLHHLATSTRTVRIRTIEVSAFMTAVIEASQIELHYLTAAPTGTAVPTARSGTATANVNAALDPRDPAPEAVALNTITATSAGIISHGFLTYGSAAAIHGGGTKIYDAQEGGPTKVPLLRAGVLEGIAIGIISNAAVTPTLTVEITYTEE